MAKTGSILVTGSEGFIGKVVCHHFKAIGNLVTGVDRGDDLLGAIKRTSPTVVIHAAGCAFPDRSFECPKEDFEANTQLVFAVLNQLREHSPESKFILLSSAAVYGNPKVLPVQEGHPIHCLSPYAFHKLMAEKICEEFTQVYGLSTTILRIFSAFGEGLERQVVWDIARNLLSGKKILSLRGTGKESRDFIHVKDIARAIEVVFLRSGFQSEIFNVASGKETTIESLATELRNLLHPEARIEFDGKEDPSSPRNWRADVSKLKALGFELKFPLEERLAEVARWCRSQHQQKKIAA